MIFAPAISCVPAFEIFEFLSASNLASDNFHPDEGSSAGILGFGMQDSAQRTDDWNPESKIRWQRIHNPVQSNPTFTDTH